MTNLTSEQMGEFISCFDCYDIVSEFATNGNSEQLRCNKCALKYYRSSPFAWILLKGHPGSIINGSTV